MLIINFNFSDIPSEIRAQLESLCVQDEPSLVIDLGHYKPFSLKGKLIERKIWKKESEGSISAARIYAGRLSSELDNAFFAAEKTLGISFSYLGIPLWDVLKIDFLSAFFYRCRAWLFFTKFLDAGKKQKIIVLRNEKLPAVDLNSWLEALKELSLCGPHEFLEIKFGADPVPPLSLNRRVRRLLKYWKTTFLNSVNKTWNSISRFVKNRGREKIIAFGFNFPNSFQLAVPSLEPLKKDYAIQLWFSSASGSRRDLLLEIAKKNGIPYGVFKKAPLSTGAEIPESRRAPLKLAEYMIQNKVYELCCGTLNAGTFPSSFFSDFFSREALEKTFFIIENIKKLLDCGKVKIMLMPGEQNTEQRIAFYFAKQKGIKTVLMLHYKYLFAVKEYAHLWASPFFADKLIVMSEKIKQDFTECGIPARLVEVTGLPKFDVSSSDLAPQSSRAFLEKWKIPGSFTGIFVWTLQGLPYEPLLLEHLEKIMPALPEKLLIVRPHPQVGKKVALPKIKNMMIHTGSTLHDVLSASELLITGTSVTAFEAILRDKPVLVLNFWNVHYPFPFLASKAAVEVFTPDETLPAIKSILENSKLQESLKKGRQEIKKDYHPGVDVIAGNLIAKALQFQTD